MAQQGHIRSNLRRPFIVFGAVVGAALSGWYVYRNFTLSVLPDPLWLICVKVALLMFSSIYLANLLRLLVDRAFKR